MGIGVSGWWLARAVSLAGQMGVVSGVALDTIVARRLQLGDPGGHLRRALSHLPLVGAGERVIERYFVPGGIPPGKPFRLSGRMTLSPRPAMVELVVAANFAEVWLAKEGHTGLVGVNYLEKIQMATPASLYGAMLAGVDWVLMGAGIPAEVPALMDALADGRAGEVSVSVEGAGRSSAGGAAGHPGGAKARLEPASLGGGGRLERPGFAAVVATHVLAAYLARNPVTRPDGFVVESPTAGGHSAPPRGPLRLAESGQPVYGERDQADLDQLGALGLPFWLAGGMAAPEQLASAEAAGAAGVQVGTAFALCRESGIAPHIKTELIEAIVDGELTVRNDALASPTGFPFKVADISGTLAAKDVYEERRRLCDLGYLRVPYMAGDGKIGYRCAAEPVDAFGRKGGDLSKTEARMCLCNGLAATVGLGQRRVDGYLEPPVATLGQDVEVVVELVARFGRQYSASDVVQYLTRKT